MTATDTGAAEGVAPGGRRQTATAVIASLLGWSLDLFDLFILLYVAKYIGDLFFPSTIPTLSLAATYASFAVTLLMRPVGAALFGHYADVHGRKGAMLIALIGVGLSTAAFGALPTIAQVGVAAPVLFLVLRLVQGVFVGGVVASTHTIGTESAPPRWRGLMSGLIGGGGAGIGALLASSIFRVMSSLFPGDAFAVWGWRGMFFCGLLSSLLGWFIFRNLEESPFFREQRQRKAAAAAAPAGSTPVRTLFSIRYRNVLLLNILITFGGGGAYYLTSGFLPSFLKLVNSMPNETASLILMGASVAGLAASLLTGALSDVIGRRMTFIAAGIAAAVLLPVCYFGLAGAKDTTAIMLHACALSFLGNATYAPTLVFLNERFPTEIRAIGTGLAWNTGFALGGIMPSLVSLVSAGMPDLASWVNAEAPALASRMGAALPWMSAAAPIPISLSIFVVVIFLVYLAGALLIPETRGNLK
jgi:MFS transporter, MHS family, proline/betaine transporter